MSSDKSRVPKIDRPTTTHVHLTTWRSLASRCNAEAPPRLHGSYTANFACQIRPPSPPPAMAASGAFPIPVKILPTLLLLLAATRVPPTRGADPDPLQDFCVADNAAGSGNGVRCLNPATVAASHFKTSALNASANNGANRLGFGATFTTAQNLPGLNTQGIAIVRTDFAPGGVVPPHSHPRAAEITFVVRGRLVAGFVDSSNRLFSQSLEPGDSFVFPRGLLHFVYNSNDSPAFTVSSFNSQSPGVVVLPQNVFASSPEIPAPVLESAFRVGPRELQHIRGGLGG